MNTRFKLPPIWEPTERHIRVYFENHLVADSKNAMLMLESDREIAYYFPISDIDLNVLVSSNESISTPERGVQLFWDVAVNGRVAQNAAWTYQSHPNRPNFEGYIAFVWHQMDHWFEESEEVFLEPRNPYHRVDFIPSERHVIIKFGEHILAQSRNPILVFETYTPTRYYLPEQEVNMSYLIPSEHRSRCQYKGEAMYYHLQVDHQLFENAIWSYRNPTPESHRVKDKLSFWLKKIPNLEMIVDGELIAK